MCSATDGCLDGTRRLLPMRLRGERAQATVETAFALPVLLVLVLLLLQPGIVLYDRVVMHGAAAEGCRLLATSSADGQANDDYIRRRLGAVPELDLFHVHSSGCSWDIQFEGNEASEMVTVRLSTELKPLPLIDCALQALGIANESGNLVVEVESSQRTQPDWVADAVEGRAPSGWVGI